MPKRVWKGRGYGQIGFAAVLAAGLVCVLYACKGFFPFGDGSVMMIDLYSQYVPLLYRFYDVITGQKNLFLDLSVAGGANLYAETINEVLNPFNYVLFVFGRERIWQAVNVLLLLYLAGGAASASLFLQKLWPDRRGRNLTLSVCYSLSAYSAYQFQIIKWMIFPVLFPLFLLALRRLLREGKGGCYALLLAWQLALSIQLGFMTLLFTLFASGLSFLPVREGRAADKTGGEERDALAQTLRQAICRLGLYTLGALLLSAPVLAPELNILFSSARAEENLSYFHVMKQHGLTDLFERLFQIAHPVLLALFCCQWMRHRRAGRDARAKGVWVRHSGEQRFWLCLTGLLWGTVLLQPANLLWHLGSYVCFPVRYGYMAQLSLIGLIGSLDGQEAGERRRLPAAFGVLLCCVAALICAFAWEDRIVQAFSSLAISSVCPAEMWMVCLILALLFIAALCAANCGNKGEGLLLAVSLVCGFCLFFLICLPRDSALRKENETAYRQMTQRYAQEGQTADRRVKESEELPLNAALVEGTNTLSGYFSTADASFRGAMGALGYETPWISLRSTGGTALSDLLLGNGERPDGLPICGIVFSETADDWNLTGDTPKARQEELERLWEENAYGRAPVFVDAAKGQLFVSLPEGMAAENERTVLFLPFAFLEGWKAQKETQEGVGDGTETADAVVRPVLGGFLGVELTGGETRVRLRFLQPGLYAGICLWVLGLALVLTAGPLSGITPVREGCYRIWQAVLAAGVLGIYLLPALGLLISLACRAAKWLGVGG